MKLHPWDETIGRALQLITQGHNVYQQFQCSGCGAKQTMPDVNAFYERGVCEECGHETDIKNDGMNYMLVTGFYDAESLADYLKSKMSK